MKVKAISKPKTLPQVRLEVVRDQEAYRGGFSSLNRVFFGVQAALRCGISLPSINVDERGV